MNKICNQCTKEKTLEEFPIKSSNRDGKSNKCKVCTKDNSKKHYLKNKDVYLSRLKRKRDAFNKWFLDTIKDFKCKNCEEGRWWVLDFHHRDPKTKEKAVSKLKREFNKEKVLREVEKCDILCANCHRDLHYQEKIST